MPKVCQFMPKVCQFMPKVIQSPRDHYIASTGDSGPFLAPWDSKGRLPLKQETSF
jgi:hypothetical protein